jgi:hypothetical protein
MSVTINTKISGGASGADVNIIDSGEYFTGTTVEEALQELGASSASPTIQVPFSGAATYLIWVGPGKAVQVVTTTGAVGSITVRDEATALTGPTIATLTTAASPETFLLNSGAGIEVYAGITIVVVGATTGYVVVQGN